MLQFNLVATKDQIKELSEIASVIWKEHYIPLIGEDQVEYMVNEFLSKKAIDNAIHHDGYEFYEIVNNEVIGFFSIKREDNSMFISKLYLRKDVRGNGYAKVTMNYIETLCRNAKLAKLWLTCNKYNETSLAIYKKLGFKIFNEAKNDIGCGYYMDDYYLEKTI